MTNQGPPTFFYNQFLLGLEPFYTMKNLTLKQFQAEASLYELEEEREEAKLYIKRYLRMGLIEAIPKKHRFIRELNEDYEEMQGPDEVRWQITPKGEKLWQALESQGISALTSADPNAIIKLQTMLRKDQIGEE